MIRNLFNTLTRTSHGKKVTRKALRPAIDGLETRLVLSTFTASPLSVSVVTTTNTTTNSGTLTMMPSPTGMNVPYLV